MNEVRYNAQEHNYMGYEYQDQIVSGQMLALCTDCYPNFGWNIEDKTRPVAGVNRYTIKMKRSRKMVNKTELTRLQRQFDSQIKEIESMEKSKVVMAAMVAYIIGIVGAAFMTGSVFAFLGGLLTLCGILAIPGFICWIVPYLSYMLIGKKKAAKVQPYIDKKYDEIYAVCERANALLL